MTARTIYRRTKADRGGEESSPREEVSPTGGVHTLHRTNPRPVWKGSGSLRPRAISRRSSGGASRFLLSVFLRKEGSMGFFEALAKYTAGHDQTDICVYCGESGCDKIALPKWANHPERECDTGDMCHADCECELSARQEQSRNESPRTSTRLWRKTRENKRPRSDLGYPQTLVAEESATQAE